MSPVSPGTAATVARAAGVGPRGDDPVAGAASAHRHRPDASGERVGDPALSVPQRHARVHVRRREQLAQPPPGERAGQRFRRGLPQTEFVEHPDRRTAFPDRPRVLPLQVVRAVVRRRQRGQLRTERGQGAADLPGVRRRQAAQRQDESPGGQEGRTVGRIRPYGLPHRPAELEPGLRREGFGSCPAGGPERPNRRPSSASTRVTPIRPSSGMGAWQRPVNGTGAPLSTARAPVGDPGRRRGLGCCPSARVPLTRGPGAPLRRTAQGAPGPGRRPAGRDVAR